MESTNAFDQVANRSEKAAFDFVDSLITLAKTQWDLWQNIPLRPDPVEYQLYTPNLTLLIGPRGAGKTFFLNYLLSRYHSHLNDQHVVWVRLDLTQKFFLRPQDIESVLIEDWIFSQATKILYRYYDETSIYSKDKPVPLKIDEVLCHHIESLSDTSEAKEALHEKRRKMRELFPITRGSDMHESASAEVPLSQGLVPSNLGLTIVNYALTKGYAFIVVFDGLDVLDSSVQEHLTFLQYSAAVQRLANDHSRLGMTYVATMRMHDGMRQYQNQYNIAPESIYCVEPVSIDSIVQRRLEFILSEEKYIKTLGGYPLDLDLKEHLDGFLEHLSVLEEGTSSRMTFMGLLTEALGDNRRAQMQVAQIQYGDYALGVTKKPYRMIESLVTEDGWLPRQRHEHICTEKGWLVPHRLRGHSFDNRLLPTLYNFPLEAEERLENVELNAEYILTNLRILQLALAPSIVFSREKQPGNLSARERNKKFPDFTVNDISILLKSLFGYDYRVVYGLVQELSDYELILLTGYSEKSPASVDRARIHLLPKAYWLLKYAASDVAFLNLAAMRCPFREQPLGNEGLFKVLPLPSLARTDELDRWILHKVTNALAMARIIGHYTKRQRRKIDSWMTSKDGVKGDRTAQYVRAALIDKDHWQPMIQRVVAQVNAILQGVELRSGLAAAERMVRNIEGFLEAHK